MSDDARPQYSYQQLNELDGLDVDQLISLYTIELSGETLYAAIADRVGNDQAAALLRRNGREEAGTRAGWRERSRSSRATSTHHPPRSRDHPGSQTGSTATSCGSSCRSSSMVTSATNGGPTTNRILPCSGCSG